MKVVADVNIRVEEQANTLFTDQEWEDKIFEELTIRFAQELRKLKPLYSKKENILDGTYLESTNYRIEAFVFSYATFTAMMSQLRGILSYEEFERVRQIFINTI